MVGGSYTFSIRAIGSSATFYAIRTFSTFLELEPVWVTGATLPNVEKGMFASLALLATGGVTYELILGNAPLGLTLSGSGFLTGIPTVEGLYTFKVRASSNSGLVFSEMEFKLVVAIRRS